MTTLQPVGAENVESHPSLNGRYVVVANPVTKSNVDELLEIVRRSAPPKSRLDVHLTDPAISLTDAIDFESGDIAAIIAIGGDGTVRSVATAIGERHVPIGIIPGGSTNIIALEHGIPRSPAEAASLIFGPHSLFTMDAGVCGNRRFLHMAGAGFDSRFFAATDQELKRRIGWRAYLRPALQQFSVPSVEFEIEADGATIRAISPLVLVANGASILKPFWPIFPDIRSDDGWLDVLIFTPAGLSAKARTAIRFATRRLGKSPYVTRVRAKHVELKSDPPIPLQLDGDVRGETPATFDILPRALTLIVPTHE